MEGYDGGEIFIRVRVGGVRVGEGEGESEVMSVNVGVDVGVIVGVDVCATCFVCVRVCLVVPALTC